MKKTPSNPKILFLAHTDNLMGGGELSVVELIKSAKKRGYNPHVVVPNDGGFAEKMQELQVGFTVIRYYYWGRQYSPKESAANITAATKIAELVRDQKFDCVISNTLTIPWGALAASMANKPHIWITREKLDNHRSHLFENYDFIEAYSNMVFANSRDNADFLKTKVGMKNVKQFYSFVNPDELQLNLRQQEPRIINLAAHIRPSKDQFELVKALAELEKRKKLNINTVFVGGYSEDDAYFREIKSFIKKNKLDNKVNFVGFYSEPYKLVGPNDVFVRSSKYESLGRTITEAMKLGLICVAADISSSKEAFELGGGVLYESGNPIDLADKLQKIITKNDSYLELAQKSKAKAQANLSESACHDPFFKELDDIIIQPNPRAELRHLLRQFTGLVESERNLEELKDHYKNLSEKRNATIEKILSSKSWKTARHLQRASNIARKPVNAVKRNKTD